MDILSELEPDSETLQALVQRLTAAKWITGINCVNAEGIMLTYTELGRTNMGALAQAVRPFAPRQFGDRWSTAGEQDLSELMRQFRGIGAQLQPPELSDKEIWLIAALAAQRHLGATGQDNA